MGVEVKWRSCQEVWAGAQSGSTPITQTVNKQRHHDHDSADFDLFSAAADLEARKIVREPSFKAHGVAIAKETLQE